MSTAADIAALGRRATFGFAPGAIDRAVGLGADRWLDELVYPDAHGVAAAPDPWVAATFENDPDERQQQALRILDAWLGALTSSSRPLVESMTWFWHDHFAVSFGVVKFPTPFARYLSRLRRHALGDFRTLLQEITTDAAMLLFLDGSTSTAAAPNENYGRELLELYGLGLDAFTEADVRAAAVALTGWTVQPRSDFAVQFIPRRHDATPQTLLGRNVRDAPGVVDAVLDHPACARFVSAKVATWFLGDGVDQTLLDSFARTFRDSGLQIAPLVRAVLRARLDGAGSSTVLSPFPWFAGICKVVGMRPRPGAYFRALSGAGQDPFRPPNVGGWPGPSAWLGASPTAGRLALATTVVDLLPASSPLLDAAARPDLVTLAQLVGLPEGFTDATASALTSLHRSSPGGRAGAAVLAVALAAPELVVA